MKGSILKSTLVVTFGLSLLISQGCSKKLLQSEGDQGAGSAQSAGGESGSKSAKSDGVTGPAGSEWSGQGINPSFPETSSGGTQGGLEDGLRGLSSDPTEERLALGDEIASVSPATDFGSRPLAELTKEEKAAMEAGLKDVYFGYDQWTLSEAGMEALNHDAKWLKENPGALLKVEGHCDERGTSAYNLVLGEKRSKSARSYLVEMGISPKQLSVISYGKERPFCMEHDESCYQQNRRGHMLLRVKNK